MGKINLLQIQAISDKNELLHAYLKSVNLNRQANIFFTLHGSSNVIMLYEYGRLLRFVVENGRYRSIPFEDPQLFAEVVRIAKWAVETRKYPYYADTLEKIAYSHAGTSKCQGLF